MNIGLSVVLAIMLLLLVLMVRNFITYSIQLKWIDEKYDREDWYQVNLPSYDHLLLNLKVWKHIPLDEYNEKYK